jgi:hypothetical protein
MSPNLLNTLQAQKRAEGQLRTRAQTTRGRRS